MEIQSTTTSPFFPIFGQFLNNILSVAVDIALQHPHEHLEQILLLYNTQK